MSRSNIPTPLVCPRLELRQSAGSHHCRRAGSVSLVRIETILDQIYTFVAVISPIITSFLPKKRPGWTCNPNRVQAIHPTKEGSPNSIIINGVRGLTLTSPVLGHHKAAQRCAAPRRFVRRRVAP